MIFQIDLNEHEIEELRRAMYSHIQNIEIFNPNVEEERFQALHSLTEKFREILNNEQQSYEPIKSTYRVLDEEGKLQPGNLVHFDVEKENWELFDPKRHKYWWGMVMKRKDNIAIISINSEDYKNGSN